jgi:hypothetical protein
MPTGLAQNPGPVGFWPGPEPSPIQKFLLPKHCLKKPGPCIVQYIHSFSEKCETKQSDCQGGLAFADFFMQTVLFYSSFSSLSAFNK